MSDNSEPNSNAHSVEAFSFTGTGLEFFRIWIVNIFLSIITLGIYSAWAKVRTRSYFYGNTHLQGNTFAYLASPIAILKGRLVAVAFIVIYSVVAEIYPPAGALLALMLMAIIPWLAVRSLCFNAINSAYRNVRFNFTGRWGEGAMALFVWPLLGVITLGILLPMAIQKQRKFVVSNSCYGTTNFDFETPVFAFYKVFLIAIGIAVLGGGVAAVIAGFIQPISIALVTLVYLALFAYFRAHIFNITYAGIGLDEHGFDASMTTGGIAWLYVTNLLGMAFTLGLFYPWARVRTARYTASCLAAKLASSLDQYIAAEIERVGALGEEMGEMLDLDIAL